MQRVEGFTSSDACPVRADLKLLKLLSGKNTRYIYTNTILMY